MSTPISPEQIAQVCHEANRGLQMALGQSPNPLWADCGEDMQQSNLHGVKVVQEGNGVDELHRQWMMVREAQGWEYGPVKNAAAKTHPNMVPFEDLPVSEQQKDMLFFAVVRALSQ